MENYMIDFFISSLTLNQSYFVTNVHLLQCQFSFNTYSKRTSDQNSGKYAMYAMQKGKQELLLFNYLKRMVSTLIQL